ncbi:methyl-accepting chemotaxis protein [Herbaspirillum autotrophicum]|uniref:methyl-accepting chemotaxis protein n=1 Tax=Herbaspirillum autotrophicum TaxID=180195 RepID=UPI00067AE346|nr:PAS domain-containing methyl-accepting chemotaxis protein [Herbaspirillum autotrophicum]
MRINMPVTNHEHQLRDTESIVSKTDLSGNISYVNPYFVEVSGFTEQELIGAPQNIVRHPDMPTEAFADLWKTLKSGMPWTGMVKNRCKNGDYYWVLANVTPIRDGGQPVGYMSVRTTPSRQQVAAAEEIYRRFREKKARGLAIKQGQVVSTGVLGKLAALRDIPLQIRIALMMGAVIVMMLAIGALAIVEQAAAIPGQRHWIAGLTGLAIMVVLYFWYALRASIVQPLKLATEVSRAIAGGDLSTKFDSSRGGDMGQLLRALQQMSVNLVAIIGDVRANVDSIQTATRDIASGNMDLSGRTEAQASSLQQTASSMGQLASTVKQNADNATQANEFATSASTVAVAGGDVVTQVTTTMGEISDSARRIVDIISLIDGIAFQTNILALNAAVEAARAGEQGRGFAVVASEVRSLAQRSASAAKEIKTLIDTSVNKVDTGVKLVNEAGTTMGEIVTSVKRVTTIMSDISAASHEQRTGIDQVNQAVSKMDEVTQQNAALVEQAAAAAASLKEQALKLSQAVSIFKLTASTRPASASQPASGNSGNPGRKK